MLCRLFVISQVNTTTDISLSAVEGDDVTKLLRQLLIIDDDLLTVFMIQLQKL